MKSQIFTIKTGKTLHNKLLSLVVVVVELYAVPIQVHYDGNYPGCSVCNAIENRQTHL